MRSKCLNYAWRLFRTCSDLSPPSNILNISQFAIDKSHSHHHIIINKFFKSFHYQLIKCNRSAETETSISIIALPDSTRREAYIVHT